MTTTDPTTILREAIKAVVIESDADDVLATRIPQACQTCKGDGTIVRDGAMGYLVDDECPDCPTIGTLLLWGWNVAKAKRTTHHNGYADSISHAQGWNACLAALREVPT